MSSRLTSNLSPHRSCQGPARARLSEIPTRSGLVWQSSALPALIDQMVVSGSRFFATVVVGRSCGAEGLGLYAVAFSLLILVNVIEESLFMAPYTFFANQREGTRRARYAASTLLGSLALGLASAGILPLLIPISIWSGGPAELTAMFWVMIPIIPFSLLREFARRHSFAHLKMRRALVLAISSTSVAAGNGIWALGRPQLNFYSASAGLMVTLALTPILVEHFAVVGASYGLLAGSICHSSLRTFLFFRLLKGRARVGIEPQRSLSGGLAA